MFIQDNVLKEYLKNVYFITGSPCGGKTTISRALHKRHGYALFDVDEQFDRHRRLSSPEAQPAMNKTFKNADEFFGRSVEDYRAWLLSNTREQLDFVLLDLICASQNQIVLCDCHLSVDQAARFTEPGRIVYLIKDPTDLIEDYCNRPDHQGFKNFINSATDVPRAKATARETLRTLNEKSISDIKNSPYLWLERDENSTVEATLQKVEAHFGW